MGQIMADTLSIRNRSNNVGESLVLHLEGLGPFVKLGNVSSIVFRQRLNDAIRECDETRSKLGTAILLAFSVLVA